MSVASLLALAAIVAVAFVSAAPSTARVGWNLLCGGVSCDELCANVGSTCNTDPAALAQLDDVPKAIDFFAAFGVVCPHSWTTSAQDTWGTFLDTSPNFCRVITNTPTSSYRCDIQGRPNSLRGASVFCSFVVVVLTPLLTRTHTHVYSLLLWVVSDSARLAIGGRLHRRRGTSAGDVRRGRSD